MSPEEYNAMRDEAQGKAPDKDVVAPDTSARDFIMGRAKEIISVPIEGVDNDVMFIRIRARLNKKEVKAHKKFLQMFQDPDSVTEEEANIGASKLLADITLDETLDEDFWSNDELDPYIAQEILAAFMEKASSTLKGVQKFRKK